MLILALETTGKYGSAAVIDDSGRVSVSRSDNEMNHLRDIIAISSEALEMSGRKKAELTHVAASRGPGSFTGIRIGVTTARTLAQMLEIPCIGVSSLEAMALRQAHEGGCTGRLIVPLINARRHQVYAGAWQETEGRVEKAFDDRQYMIEEILEILDKENFLSQENPVVFTGDGIDAYDGIIEETLPAGTYALSDESLRYQDAGSVAEVAMSKALSGAVLSYGELLPDYMRLAEAEQKLKDGTLSPRIKK